MAEIGRRCPDLGACHHDCGEVACWRVRHAEPLSGRFYGNQWPEDVRQLHDTRQSCEQETAPGIECGYSLRPDGLCPNEAAHLTNYAPPIVTPRIVEHEGHKGLHAAEERLIALQERVEKGEDLDPSLAFIEMGLALVAHGRAVTDAVDAVTEQVAEVTLALQDLA